MNIAQQKAINLIEKHTLPFVSGDDSDFLIARNSALHEVNFEIDKYGMFGNEYWRDVKAEILKINYEKYCILKK